MHKEIGSGNFSRVFRATHRLDGVDYAVKRTKHAVEGDARRNQWLQEVQALAAVAAHPNIVQYYGAWAVRDDYDVTLCCACCVLARRAQRVCPSPPPPPATRTPIIQPQQTKLNKLH